MTKINKEIPPHKRQSKISTEKLLERMKTNHKLLQKRRKKVQVQRFGWAVHKFIKENVL